MIDTHLHLWDTDRFRYSWLDEVPELQRTYNLGHYRASDTDVITSSIFIECAVGHEFCFEEAKWALALASVPENRLSGVVASVWPEREDFPFLLEKLFGPPHLKGLRRVLHTEPDGVSQSRLFRQNLRSLSRFPLNFELCVKEQQLPLAIELADACPETRFILNHCGGPNIAMGAKTFWEKQIAEIARRPNVFCKISGLLLHSGRSKCNASEIFPWFSRVVEAFGWDRIVWGSDWPVCTLAAPLQDWITLTAELLDLAMATDEQRAGILNANAKFIYRL